LKPARGSARAQVFASELFAQFFFAVDDLGAALDAGFGRETAAALTAALESRSGGRAGRIAWQTSRKPEDYSEFEPYV
jgi:hypothetical protein